LIAAEPDGHRCRHNSADLFAKKQREKTKSKIEITYS